MTRQTRLEQIVDAAGQSGARLHVMVGADQPVAEIWLEGALIVAAAAEGDSRRMAARLVADGVLTGEEVRVAQAAADADRVPLSQTVAGRVRRDALESIAADEARYALAAALAAASDQIVTRDGSPGTGRIALTLDAAAALQEAQTFLSSIRDAQALVTPGMKPCAEDGVSEQDSGLDPHERIVLAACDGVSTVTQISDALGLPTPATCVSLASLAQRGLVVLDVDEAQAEAFLAELEAAQQIGDHQAVHAVTLDESPTPIEVPATTESVDTPADGTDTQALMRELASLSRLEVRR